MLTLWPSSSLPFPASFSADWRDFAFVMGPLLGFMVGYSPFLSHPSNIVFQSSWIWYLISSHLLSFSTELTKKNFIVRLVNPILIYPASSLPYTLSLTHLTRDVPCGSSDILISNLVYPCHSQQISEHLHSVSKFLHRWVFNVHAHQHLLEI